MKNTITLVSYHSLFSKEKRKEIESRDYVKVLVLTE